MSDAKTVLAQTEWLEEPSLHSNVNGLVNSARLLRVALAASEAEAKVLRAELRDRCAALDAIKDGKSVDYFLVALAETNRLLLEARARVEALERASQSGGTGEWQRCPVCDGRGDHMREFYDGPGPSDGTTRVVCRTCRGIAVICRPGVAALAAGEVKP